MIGYIRRAESVMRHLKKHITCWWYQRQINMPRWENDQIAKMLGVAQYGCPSCGYGAIKERDRVES